AAYGVARRAARPVGADGGDTPVRVEVVEMNASLVSSGKKERPVCADRKTATAKQRDPTAVRVREASPIRLEEEEVVSPSRHLHEPRRQRHTWTLEWLGGCFGAPGGRNAPRVPCTDRVTGAGSGGCGGVGVWGGVWAMRVCWRGWGVGRTGWRDPWARKTMWRARSGAGTGSQPSGTSPASESASRRAGAGGGKTSR